MADEIKLNLKNNNQIKLALSTLSDAEIRRIVSAIEETLQDEFNTKADKSTTLSGYGITDAYTKTEADNKYPVHTGEGEYSAIQNTDQESWNIGAYYDDYIAVESLDIKKDEQGNVFVGAYGKNSTVMGGKSQAIGARAFAEGSKSVALANTTHAEGELNIAGGYACHTEGVSNISIAPASHAEGNRNQIGATGNNAHVEGCYNYVEADSAHAEGNGNVIHVGAGASHVGGKDSVIEEGGGVAFVHGQGLIGNRNAQIVLGSYNISDSSKDVIIGNGTDENNRSNSFELDDNGNAVFAGNVTANGASLVKDFELTSAVNGIEKALTDGTLVVTKASYADEADHAQIAWLNKDYYDLIPIITNPTPTEIEVDGVISHNLSYTFEHNTVIRANGTPTTIEFVFNDNIYPEYYSSELCFDCGETATMLVYPDAPILNWVGTDCAVSDDNYSIFSPQANTHYDILFYYNGTNIVGLVNGYKFASGNA